MNNIRYVLVLARIPKQAAHHKHKQEGNKKILEGRALSEVSRRFLNALETYIAFDLLVLELQHARRGNFHHFVHLQVPKVLPEPLLHTLAGLLGIIFFID